MADELRAVLRLSGPDTSDDDIVVGRQGLRAGRSNDNSLVLNHREISRQHFRILWREDDVFLVEDLNSSNGVFFNDTRIPPRVAQELREGDIIRAGPFVLTLERFIQVQSLAPMRQPALQESLPPLARDGAYSVIPGIARERSTWLEYLPAIYSDDEFIGRFLLIFESIMDPIVWMIDNFDLYLSPEVAPQEWLAWMAGWFDVLLVPELPIERQRNLLQQIGWLFMRRGTRVGLERLLELYFGVQPEIIEDPSRCHFTVILPLSNSTVGLGADIAERLITTQRPAFASFTLQVS